MEPELPKEDRRGGERGRLDLKAQTEVLPTLHPTLQRDKHSLEPGSNMKQMLEFSNKDIKITRINMSKALTEKADNRSD